MVPPKVGCRAERIPAGWFGAGAGRRGGAGAGRRGGAGAGRMCESSGAAGDTKGTQEIHR
ncbi:hypothetical protein GCM10028793_43210 [Nocardiopsis oceani]